MAVTLDEYKRLFREATVSDQMKLSNFIWLFIGSKHYLVGHELDGLNQDRTPLGNLLSPVGWGLLIVVHYWFHVRGAENLCKLREVIVEAK